MSERKILTNYLLMAVFMLMEAFPQSICRISFRDCLSTALFSPPYMHTLGVYNLRDDACSD